ncbi:CASP10 (predicted) [Pycnogonum litorale]
MNDNVVTDAKPDSTYAVRRKKIPARVDLRDRIFQSIADDLDEDDKKSLRFMCHGLRDTSNIDIKQMDRIQMMDKLELSTYLSKLSDNPKDSLVILKELLFLIKRYDLFPKHFNICHHQYTPNVNETSLLPTWPKLFTLYEDITDVEIPHLRSLMNVPESVSNCDDVIINWYRAEGGDKFHDKLSSILQNMNKQELHHKLYGYSTDKYYDMSNDPCGIAIIFNFKSFENPDLQDRSGTEIDCIRLEKVFKNFGFIVETHDNLKSSQVLEELGKIASLDHSVYNCFICCILSHGEEGIFFTNEYDPTSKINGIISVETVKKIFTASHAPSLVNKPKCFFIQACQGQSFQSGIQVPPYDDNLQTDSSVSSIVPDFQDMLVSKATVTGYFSFRHKIDGSWFIQSLADALEKYGVNMEIKDVLIEVNKAVASQFAQHENGSISTQMPIHDFTLTKLLKFKRSLFFL